MPQSVFHHGGIPFTGKEVMEVIRQEQGNKVLLAFSCGKDSIAAWLKLKEEGFEVVPFYLWSIPNMKFIEDSILYYEQVFDTHIIRLPHPSFYRMLNNFVFQPPDRVAVIRSLNIPNYDYDDITRIISQTYQLGNIFTATGVRAADSPNRRSMISQHGAINWNRRVFYPVWDMSLDSLVAVLAKHNVKLSRDYELFGRSFDGIDYRFTSIIKKEYPEDYKKIIFWFPLVELEHMRHEQTKNRIKKTN